MLRDRLDELEALQPSPPGLAEFVRSMPSLPLFHRLGEPLRGATLTLEVAAPKAGRAPLGTDSCIFASVGVAAYLTPPLVLAFGPLEETRTGRRTAPWDTRELRAVLRCDAATHTYYIDSYSLPAPDDEVYLAHYLARCFDHLHQWLGGRRPTGADTLGVLAALARNDYTHEQAGHEAGERRIRMTTPEARFSASVSLSSGLLLAAFADVDHAVGHPDERGWAATYRTLERLLGDDFRRLRRSASGVPDLRGEAYRFVCEWLTMEGLP